MVVKLQENLTGLSGLVNGKKVSLGYFLTRLENMIKNQLDGKWQENLTGLNELVMVRKSHWGGKWQENLTGIENSKKISLGW